MNQLVQELIKDLLEQKNQDYTIYLDIDDTLTNYSERLKSMIIDDPETGEKRPIKASDTVDNLEFWSSAKWLHGAEEMVNFIKDNFDKVEILSAVPELSKAKQAETGERFWNAPILGKEDWLKHNVGDIKTNWVRSGSQKAAFARPNTVLIDDKPENIRAFQKAGGIGILYDNPSNVVAQLQDLLKPELNEWLNDEDNLMDEVVNSDGDKFEYKQIKKGLFTYEDSLGNLYFVRMTYQPTDSPYFKTKIGWFEDNNLSKPKYEPNLPPNSTSLDNIKRRNTVAKIYRDEILPLFLQNSKLSNKLIIKPISNSRFIFSQRLIQNNTPKDFNVSTDKENNILTITPILKEAIVGDEIVCDNCGWHWPIADGGDDLYICHKCGHDNTPVNEVEGESNPDPSINRNNIPGWSFKDYLKSFLKYAIQHMNIQPLPRLILIKDDVKNAEEMLGMTGYYNPTDKSVTLFTLGRHPKDILRTLAHELVHHEQNLEDRLDHSQTTDTNKDSKLSSIEDEAYLKGSRIFRHWEDQLKEPMNEMYFLDDHKFNQPKTFVDKLCESLHEITLNPSNAAEIYGDLTNGKFQVGDIIYVYDIAQVKNPYNDGGDFYNIMFHPKDNVTSIPQQGKENYIKILNTMYKVILDFSKEIEPEYIGIASLDNNDTKNYHKIYANLTDNKFNNIPGYFRKDVSLGFDTPQGKGRFVVLKRKDV